MEEKLDLIISTLNAFQTEIRDRLGNVENRLGNVENRLGDVENRLGSVENRTGGIEAELRAFREEVNARFTSVHKRIGQLENFIVALGAELKNEIKDEVRRLQRQADKIQADILNARSENFGLKVDLSQIEERIERAEQKLAA